MNTGQNGSYFPIFFKNRFLNGKENYDIEFLPLLLDKENYDNCLCCLTSQQFVHCKSNTMFFLIFTSSFN